VVAAAFGVFNPAAVIPAVHRGWTLTDAATISQARTTGAVAQLRRILGDEPDGLARATSLLVRANDGLRPEGRPLFAGLVALGLPGEPLGDMWRLGDRLREYRGDAHIAAWSVPDSTPPRSAFSPSRTGAYRYGPTCAPGPGATPTWTPPRPAW